MGSVRDLTARSVRDGDCLRWTGAHTPKGYGQIAIEGKRVAVHRLAHEFWIGPIPEGHEIDHVQARGCRYRDCIEPTHLEAVTHAENVARQLATITHCPQGHEYTKENSIMGQTSKGYPSRKCRTCKNARHAAWKAARRG